MGRHKKKEKRPFVSKLLFVLLFLVLVYLYARYIGTSGILLNEHNVVDENIPSSFDGFTIAHFSDLEYGSTIFIEEIQILVDKINEVKPEIVVFTGDLISGDYELTSKETKQIIDIFKKLNPLIDTYSVRGDNDVNSIYDEIISESGIKDISNNYELIYYKGLTPIVLYGLDSNLKGKPDYDKAFAYPSPDDDPIHMATYRILLCHEPDVIDELKDYNLSLILAGHSHNSQINLPYIKDIYNIDGASNYYEPEYDINGTKLFISGGLGTEKVKLRIFSKPSINVYRLYTD